MRKSKHYRGEGFLPLPGSDDPVGRILTGAANILIDAEFKVLSREVGQLFGLPETSVEQELARNRSQLQLEKQKADTEKAKALSQMQVKYLDLKIQEKNLEIQERTQRLESARAQSRQLLLPTVTKTISGALEVTATPDGLAGSSPDQLGAYQSWIKGASEGGVVMACFGRKGSGKSAFLAKFGEYMYATYRMPFYWVGLPPEARRLLPHWIRLVDSVEQCPPGCFIIVDEAGITYLSLAFNTDRNKFLRAQLMICRHRYCSMAFAVQSSRDMDNSIVRLCDSFIFKEPSLHQPLSEKPDLKGMAKKAALVFDQIPKDERRQAAYVFDSD